MFWSESQFHDLLNLVQLFSLFFVDILDNRLLISEDCTKRVNDARHVKWINRSLIQKIGSISSCSLFTVWQLSRLKARRLKRVKFEATSFLSITRLGIASKSWIFTWLFCKTEQIWVSYEQRFVPFCLQSKCPFWCLQVVCKNLVTFLCCYRWRSCWTPTIL